MPRLRLTVITTRTGDAGATSLGGGQRLPKDAPRIEACGTVDELNSSIGVALALKLSARPAAILKLVQNDLFQLGSDLCLLEADKAGRAAPRIEARHVERLDAALAACQKRLAPLAEFLLPGGTPGAAQLHVCRCVCRRAERRVVRLAREEPVGPHVVRYLNRLSDLLFVLARVENLRRRMREQLWEPERPEAG